MEKYGYGKFGEFVKSSVIRQTNFLPKSSSIHFRQTLLLLKFSAIQYPICY